MSDSNLGSISWIDLTVDDASRVRDFYSEVVGWTSSGVDMGGYEDFNMMPPSAETPVAGVCHALGSNADLPPQWLIYITVPDLDASIATCTNLAGEIISGPRELGPTARFCVIRDPAGAVAALFESS